ncbi:hypothetical protein TrLO_g3199 [Triparma laevis f. longispina]|uniref:non-specific serine/threonine protein kinase n=1 Tax=Triparma laevis f. longispina TaxID=1714387 RepID=A0A9W7FBE6_9STRA|nr:hypothetical protein TrLO_g3199 [Triparma laevis f. longispina]
MGACQSNLTNTINQVTPTPSSSRLSPRPSEPSSARDDPNYNKPDAVLARLDYSPNAELRHLQFEKEIRSLKEKKGGSRIFRKMSSTNRIGDIERVHQLRAQMKDRRKSVDFIQQKYGRRGSLDYDSDPSNHEMRYLLETSTGQKHLVDFMSTHPGFEEIRKRSLVCMHCWLDCLSYSEISNPQFRCSKAIEIYNYYVEKTSPMYVDVLEDNHRQKIRDNMMQLFNSLLPRNNSMLVKQSTEGGLKIVINEEEEGEEVGERKEEVEKKSRFFATGGKKLNLGEMEKPLSFSKLMVEREGEFDTFNFRAIKKNNFDALSNVSFRFLVNAVLGQFKMSPEYGKFRKELEQEDAMSFGVDIRRRKCRIFVDDFQYVRLLGKGGFARVVHVVKRSTGQHYAMKIQSKAALVKFHGMNEGGLELEKTMIANNRNPFIVDLQYALQTELCAILVLGLVGGGDLSDLIASAPKGRLPEPMAQVYTYEIAFALNHLHENGVVFRDLKPSNILVDDNGHLKLTDMGLAAPLYVYENKNASKDNDSSTAPDNSSAADSDLVPSSIVSEANAIEEAMRDALDSAKMAQGGNDSSVKMPTTRVHRKASLRTSPGNVKRKIVRKENTPSVELSPGVESRSSQKSQESDEGKGSAFGYDDGGDGPVSFIPADPLDDEQQEWETKNQDRVEIKRKSIVGTRAYLAPEMLEQTFEKERTGYSSKVDYFALGVTVFEMVVGRRPWANFEPSKGNRSSEIADPFAMDSENLMKIIQLRQDRKRFPPGFVSKLHKVDFPSHVSPPCCDLINRLLERDADIRLGYKAVCDHDWLKNQDINKLMKYETSDIPVWVKKSIAERKRKNFLLSLGSNKLNSDQPQQWQPKYKNFDDLMSELKEKDKNHSKLKWHDQLTNESQKLFADWDYIAPSAIKNELDILNRGRLRSMSESGV